jgi:hypothetical protein
MTAIGPRPPSLGKRTGAEVVLFDSGSRYRACQRPDGSWRTVPKDRRVTDNLLVLGESKLPAARPTLLESSNRDGAIRLHGGRRHVLIERRLRYPDVAANLDISDASLDDTSIDETNSNL